MKTASSINCHKAPPGRLDVCTPGALWSSVLSLLNQWHLLVEDGKWCIFNLKYTCGILTSMDQIVLMFTGCLKTWMCGICSMHILWANVLHLFHLLHLFVYCILRDITHVHKGSNTQILTHTFTSSLSSFTNLYLTKQNVPALTVCIWTFTLHVISDEFSCFITDPNHTSVSYIGQITI